jgi:hypothetical protein
MTGASPRARRIIGPIVCGILAALLLVTSVPAQLPETMPAPPRRPDSPPAESTLPQAGDIPVPRPRPRQDKAGTAGRSDPSGKSDEPAPMPAEELACRARLRELGVKFEERQRLSSESGCLIAHPVAITSLGRSVAIEPEAVLNCATARTAAQFVADVVLPETKTAFGSPVVSVRHGSAYVCRTRHAQTKMSEHAFGNALDFSAFELGDGTMVEVKAYGPGDQKRRDFIRKLRAEACGPFKTVLGPGTDADHAYHLHFDLQPRRRGGTYCK